MKRPVKLYTFQIQTTPREEVHFLAQEPQEPKAFRQYLQSREEGYVSRHLWSDKGARANFRKEIWRLSGKDISLWDDTFRGAADQRRLRTWLLQLGFRAGPTFVLTEGPCTDCNRIYLSIELSWQSHRCETCMEKRDTPPLLIKERRLYVARLERQGLPVPQAAEDWR